MSELDVNSETVQQDSDQYDDNVDGNDRDRINKSSPELKRERALLVKHALLAEQQWFQNLEVVGIFMKLEGILRGICKRMNLSQEVGLSIRPKAGNPTAEKLSLMQRTGTEVFKCSVMLLRENVIQTEVVIKYPKIAGGVYRGTAQPHVHWKLQQLQDAGNYFARALSMLAEKLKWIKQIPPEDIGKMPSNIISIITKITNLIGQARSTLCMPEKRTLLELCNSAIIRCFNPPLPPDLVFSYYISANRLVCAACQATMKANGAQTLTVIFADCLLPQLVDVLFLTDRALNVTQQFNCNMRILKEQLDTYNHICS